MPSAAQLLQSAKDALSDVDDWKRGKPIHGVEMVSRGKRAGDGVGWHGRRSLHPADELSYDAIWAGLRIAVGELKDGYEVVQE